MRVVWAPLTLTRPFSDDVPHLPPHKEVKRGGPQSYRGIPSNADQGHSTMYKKVARLKVSVVEVSSSVQCNKCGRETALPEDPQPGHFIEAAQEYHSFSASGGYSSKYPEDLTTIKWVMCADCLRSLVETFLVQPEESGYMAPFKGITAKHTDTGEMLSVQYGLAYTQGQLADGVTRDLDQDLLDTFTWPALGVFQHYKGGLYTTVGACLTADTQEPLVVYQALYGASESYVRPLAQWFAAVSGPDDNREVLRFTEVSFPPSAP